MKSKITDKFQTTVPREIREKLKLSRNDYIDWRIEKGYVIIEPVKKSLLDLKGCITVGEGNIRDDIERARNTIAGKVK